MLLIASTAAQNPFGSPTPAPLAPQLTGVQFSTPSPETFAGNHHMNAISPQYTGMNAQQSGFGNTFNGEFWSKTGLLYVMHNAEYLQIHRKHEQ